ncbi:MAG: hypothetical protein ACE5KA_05555 [Nitrososphaerales archaeon]
MIPKADANQIIQMLAQGLANIQVQADQKDYVLLDLSNDVQGEASNEKYYIIGPLIISNNPEQAARLRQQLREIIDKELGLKQ